MPVYIKDQDSVLFIHIPKTGGSSLENMMVKAGWQELCAVRGMRADQIRYFRSTPQHWHAELLTRLFDLHLFSRIITLVRHPFPRMKSEYYWQVRQGMTDLAPADWFRRALDGFNANPFAFDNHLRPQTDFVPENVPVDIFRMEDSGIMSAWRAVNGPSAPEPEKLLHVKKSGRTPEAEMAFEALRGDIETFYAEDLRRFYQGASSDRPEK